MIENNNIHDNIKSNIAYGGEKSADTHIIKNKIHSGRCEGIFMIDGGKSYINRNKIYQNNIGIILITSSPFIMNNKICGNKFHGHFLPLNFYNSF